jgi:hypothetical protein
MYIFVLIVRYSEAILCRSFCLFRCLVFLRCVAVIGPCVLQRWLILLSIVSVNNSCITLKLIITTTNLPLLIFFSVFSEIFA